MMSAAGSVAALVGLVVLALVLVVVLLLAVLPLLQTLAAIAARSTVDTDIAAARDAPRVAILVPAHDEAAGIGATLASLLPQLAPHDRLVVIADNCSDDTAAVARRCGAEVIERHDLVLRGKGHALAHGHAYLQADPPDVLLMFDADCTAGPACVARLARMARSTGRPVQSLYLLRAANDGVRARLSEFAFRLRNRVRPLGMRRLGLPCQLMGSGMAFEWPLLSSTALASGHLTEDLQLGIALARRGLAPVFCPEATVDSTLASDAKGATAQRTRWEHGHLGILVAEFPRLIGAAIRRRDPALLMMAWDLAVPPFALFVAIELVLAAITATIVVAGGPAWPIVMAAIALVLTGTTIFIARRAFARDLISLGEIVAVVPLYLVRKVPVYLRFVFRRQVDWVRTRRDTDR